MGNGNWSPLTNDIFSLFTVRGEFSEFEAFVSLQMNVSNNNPVTLSGLARSWGWDRGRVRRFIERFCLKIEYPNNTRNDGYLVKDESEQKTNRRRTDNEQIKFLKNNDLEDSTNRKRTEDEQITNTIIRSKNKNKEKPNGKWLEEIAETVNYLNEKTGKSFKPNTAQTRKLISGRLNDGYTVDDFKKVIDVKFNEWGQDDKMKNYVRPETLFSPSKFEAYLNQSPSSGSKSDHERFHRFE